MSSITTLFRCSGADEVAYADVSAERRHSNSWIFSNAEPSFRRRNCIRETGRP
jgi:hypothetical protein